MANETVSSRDTLLTTELVPEQILPKVLTTFGLTAVYVFIICWITGSSVMATGGWASIPFWVLGILTFLIPAGLAVSELGNLWPGQGGVYIWAYRTMSDNWAFVGGFLSWVPVILNGASGPATVLQMLLLAFHAQLGTTVSVILQLVILWAVVGMALAKLAASQKVMNTVFITYCVLTGVIFFGGVAYAVSHGVHSASPFHASDLLKPNFAASGFLFGTVLLYLVGVEVPFNMGAEFLSVRKSATRMIFWGSVGLVLIYILTTIGTMLVLPTAKINSVTGVIDNLGTSVSTPVMDIAAVVLAIIVFTALATYSIAYSRLIFVSGLERHLPRIFTHLNPRTRNPVTAILIQAAISSVLIVALFSQSSLANVTIYLTGALSVIWLASSLFFFIPPLIARYKYADRYAKEDFWRIPGGMPGVWVTCVIGIASTLAGIYYSFAASWLPNVPNTTWMTWLGAIVVCTLVLMGVVYFFGRRSAAKLTKEDALAEFAKLDLSGGATGASEAV